MYHQSSLVSLFEESVFAPPPPFSQRQKHTSRMASRSSLAAPLNSSARTSALSAAPSERSLAPTVAGGGGAPSARSRSSLDTAPNAGTRSSANLSSGAPPTSGTTASSGGSTSSLSNPNLNSAAIFSVNSGGILYAAIGFGIDDVVEFNRCGSQTVKATARQVLQGASRTTASRATFHSADNLFNLQSLGEGKPALLCVTNQAFPRLTAFYFLDTLQSLVSSAAMVRDRMRLDAELRRLAEKCSDPKNDKFGKLRDEIDQVKNTMLDNVDRVVERQGHVEDLVGKTSDLRQATKNFQLGATEIKKASNSRRIWLTVGVVVMVIVILAVIILVICSKEGCWK